MRACSATTLSRVYWHLLGRVYWYSNCVNRANWNCLNAASIVSTASIVPTASIVSTRTVRVGALSYWLFCPRHKKRPECPTVSLVLQKQRLHLAAAPVIYRKRQLLAGQVVLPQKVSYEVDASRVEQLGVQVRNLGSRSEMIG